MTNFLLFVLLAVFAIGVYNLLQRITIMSANFDRLTAEVAENTAVTASAKALVLGLAEQLRAALGDDAALGALADQLDRDANSLAGAVAENTVAADEPAPADEPLPEPEPAPEPEPQG